MRLGSSAGRTDPGRKRRRNEDAYVVDPPLFAVADGMGGAQAGEVASRLAAAAFREYHEADDLEPEERLKAIIGEANHRIYERAQSDTEVTGMGTTVTAALFEGAGVAIGHVGDSRAYRMRGGELKQLTSDHSLVADLMRSGRLTAEEAESHPQRSVITRALGTDPDIDVDTLTVEASPGDLFLLCSDGLTSMVPDDEILELIQNGRSLESMAKALVKAANRSGGEDNITVVLFSVEGEEALEETLARGDGRGSDEELEDTLSGLPVPPELAAAGTAVVAPPTDEPAGWPEEPVEPAVAAPPKPPPPRQAALASPPLLDGRGAHRRRPTRRRRALGPLPRELRRRRRRGQHHGLPGHPFRLQRRGRSLQGALRQPAEGLAALPGRAGRALRPRAPLLRRRAREGRRVGGATAGAPAVSVARLRSLQGEPCFPHVPPSSMQ